MDFTAKYISVEEYDNLKPEQSAKETRKVIGNDAYAVAEAVHCLIQQLKELGNRIR
jgi:hypothetical protein